MLFKEIIVICSENHTEHKGPRTWTAVEGSCEHGNESLGSIKCWEILE
jgi:hypothetical protein